MRLVRESEVRYIIKYVKTNKLPFITWRKIHSVVCQR